MIPFFLLAIGLLLVFTDFYLASIVLGSIGGFVILASIFAFAIEYESLLALFAYVFFVIAALVALVKFALWLFKSTEPNASLYSDSSQEGFTASSFDPTAVGKIGIVLADLKPGGYIAVEGHKHAAISLSGYITKGHKVFVVGGEGENLTVQSFTKDEI